jgi:hypothetical protein
LSHHQCSIICYLKWCFYPGLHFFFLILDPSISLDWACSICSQYVGHTISWANSSPPELIPNSAPISFNSASYCSSHNVGLLRVALFLCLRALATTFAFLGWYFMVQS